MARTHRDRGTGSQPLAGRTVAVVGGGPAGLMAAERLAVAGAAVTVYDRMPSVGRKLLLAGRGGLNLTHSEPSAPFLARYGDAAADLEPALRAFGPAELRAWCEQLGQPTFVGTSGRVFPEALRATPLLRAWLRRLQELGVELRVRHEWVGWADAAEAPTDAAVDARPAAPPSHRRPVGLRFRTGDVERVVRVDAAVLALGGASWPRVGANGAWVGPVTGAGVDVVPLRPANCGFEMGWSEAFRSRFAGAPVKNVALEADGMRSRGDAVITASGIEGGPVYALSARLRDALAASGTATLHIDLAPDLTVDALAARLRRRRPKATLSSVLRRAGLDPVHVGVLREGAVPEGGPGPASLPRDSDELARRVKAVPLVVRRPAPIERAISTAGGVARDAIDAHWMLRARPGTFVAGEMIDWEAPTGGYLLQATFSTAVAAADGVVAWLTAETDAGGCARV